MALFELAIPTVLRREGGYVDDPNDPGGETNFGVCKRSYPNVDIKNLTIEEATAIYKRDWWDHYGYGNIEAQAVATKIFDMAINLGAGRAHRMVQEVLGLVQDGIFGPKTLSEINAVPSLKTLIDLQNTQAEYYRHLVEVNPDLQKFLSGWLNRAYDRC